LKEDDFELLANSAFALYNTATGGDYDPVKPFTRNMAKYIDRETMLNGLNIKITFPTYRSEIFPLIEEQISSKNFNESSKNIQGFKVSFSYKDDVQDFVNEFETEIYEFSDETIKVKSVKAKGSTVHVEVISSEDYDGTAEYIEDFIKELGLDGEII
jgi:hypothetical protein